MYLKFNEKAIEKYREMCKEINCDFENKDAYIYSLKNRQDIENEVTAVNSLGVKAEFVEKTLLPFSIKGAIKYENHAQFNPLKFIAEIAKDLNIYENTFIKSIENDKAISDKAVITAKKIIVATHFPFLNKHGSYFLKMYQSRSYVIALKDAADVNGMYVDEAQKGMSFRNYKDLLLIGGGDHRTGKQGGNWRELREFAKVYYINAKEKFFWATQDCMTLDDIPYIGNYSNSTPNLYVGTGFNKWGITGAMCAAMLLTDMVQEKKNQFAEIYNPSRSILKPKLIVNGFEAVTNIITIAPKRCPHLGCKLNWNSVEHTWDCPCHGSRFEENGKLIDNPAMKSLEK